ncbi:MAG: hypothetical protein AB7O56_05995 [Bauldia sp.]
MFKQGLAIAAAATLLAGCVVDGGTVPSFPNPGAAPAFGSVSVNPGQLHTVSITAGGSINASVLGGNCRGYIASSPDFVVNFSTLAGLLPLTFRVNANADTTLVVYDPNGRWLCDDDSGGNLNPYIQVNGPTSGRYAVWVGTYAGGIQSSTLRINSL